VSLRTEHLLGVAAVVLIVLALLGHLPVWGGGFGALLLVVFLLLLFRG
jgi:hypothetical protein